MHFYLDLDTFMLNDENTRVLETGIDYVHTVVVVVPLMKGLLMSPKRRRRI